MPSVLSAVLTPRLRTVYRIKEDHYLVGKLFPAFWYLRRKMTRLIIGLGNPETAILKPSTMLALCCWIRLLSVKM